ncbi:MarR family winged helix-turn-helix transcriptional regulator [Flavihumibacter petaseus]|uniref:Putative MarR family transcriptional regulator n=1 Tax=Flavihumibacter petaseus NBRC 106054 TaxID=1220578 RepID=A0A0E9MYD7_9BACT|nr:MarR family winged helix-turn-helix transcriptional regulator [Flavihumibacter petaseus]GAO42747.1 putative MarR family transcriptional regulator [Flavihumibacter petaseus NBRC 106054]
MAAYINTGVYLRILWDELRYNMESQLKENGYEDISPSHGWIFYNTGEEGSRITDLAAKARITKQSMSVLVAQLETGGYVKKLPDPNDKRAWILVLTAKGKKVKAIGQQINYKFEERWKDSLGEKDYSVLRQLLATLCEG